MLPFIQRKKFDKSTFMQLLEPAQASNIWTNGGYCTYLLEELARDMLKIDNSKAIIAVSSGTAALHAITDVIRSCIFNKARFATQNFTFAANRIGPLRDSLVLDFDRGETVDFRHKQGLYDVLIVTNCFGHLQDLDFILEHHKKNQLVVFDNAASPYSFTTSTVENKEYTNSCNLGFASAISLHHTKPIGFGEGGLIIINKEYETIARTIINFGLQDGEVSTGYANNYKMSELSAAGIIQWWHQFKIDDLANAYWGNYCRLLGLMSFYDGKNMLNHAIRSFPSCFPWLGSEVRDLNVETKKYYKPLVRSNDISNKMYNEITCYPIYDGVHYNG
jgi:dTDP-4-amino-4,6-dideoxygalactose transaminase